MAHLRAIQDITDISAGSSAAACTEGMAAVDDLAPVLPLLNIGRVLPFATARAWGQVPRLVDAARDACPPIQLYADLAPWPGRSIQSGAAADLLANVRHEQAQLQVAQEQLTRAWDTLAALDAQALLADPRLARVARLVSAARAQQADVADALTLASPDHLENLLGGDGARSIVLSVIDGDATSQAYAVVQDGRVTGIDVGAPSVAPAAMVAVDRNGLASLESKLSHLHLADDTTDADAARAVLDEIVQAPLSSDENVVSAIRHSAEAHQAWLWFEDPALQELASRRGWVQS